MLLCRLGGGFFQTWVGNALRRRCHFTLHNNQIHYILLLIPVREHITLSNGSVGSPVLHRVRQYADWSPCRFRGSELNTTVAPYMHETTFFSGSDKGRNRCNESENEGSYLQHLRASAITLRGAADAELEAEVERDCRDGVAAIPPLPPAGWKVRHPAGSNYFIMTHTLRSGVLSGEFHARRYHSVHDTFVVALKRSQKQRKQWKKQQKQDQAEEHEDLSGDNGVNRLDPSLPFTTKVEFGYSTDKERRAVLHKVNEEETLDETRGQRRADVHITVFAPFRVYDPSLHDHSVDICEWSHFDVLVRKTPLRSDECMGDSQAFSGSLPNPVADKGLCMFVRLASVNSEMRICSIQLFSSHEARALEEHACFGQGEPMFLELLHRCRNARAAERSPRFVRCYDEPSAANKEELPRERTSLNGGILGPMSSSGGMHDFAYELLTNCFDSCGEYSRTLCYGGPYVTELSKEMIEVFEGYLQGDLGISSRLCEYVCQMQFFLEQEEYTAWLARLRHVADVVSEHI